MTRMRSGEPIAIDGVTHLAAMVGHVGVMTACDVMRMMPGPLTAAASPIDCLSCLASNEWRNDLLSVPTTNPYGEPVWLRGTPDGQLTDCCEVGRTCDVHERES